MPRKLIQGTAPSGVSALGGIAISTSTISSISTNENIQLSPGGAGNVVIPSPFRTTNTEGSIDKDSGSIVTEGGVGVQGSVYAGGLLRSTGGLSNTVIGDSSPVVGTFTDISSTGTTTLAEHSEAVGIKTGATGTVVHDYTESNQWLHTSISANFTVNLTNVPTTDDRLYTIVLYLSQGATGRLATAFQIDGVAQTLLYSGNTLPRAGTNSFDTQTFTLIRSSGAWRVITSLTVNSTTYPGTSAANPAPSGYWLAQNLKTPLSLTSGLYWIKSSLMPNALQMYVDMTQEDGGYDFYPITGGTTISAYGETHSGLALGLDLVFPRSPQHWQAMRNYVTNVLGDSGNAFFQVTYVVYRTTSTTGGSRGGNYTGVIMRDPRFYGTGTSDWRTGDGGRWWLRNSTFGEPNGDYSARGFLGLTSGGYSFIGYAGGDVSFNDGANYPYPTGTSYLVSTNAKP
jgi:hypothetical protein